MQYDLIICGGGAAGLSMIGHLLRSPMKDLKVLLIDIAKKADLSKTWSFWDEHPPVYFHPRHQWKSWVVKNNQIEVIKNLNNLSYYAVNAQEFHEHMWEKILDTPNIDFVCEEILAILPKDEYVEVQTLNQVYEGKYALNSIPSLFSSQKVNSRITQNFKGWRIRTNKPIFDPSAAILMDFIPLDSNSVDFFYVLPFSENEALIEYTRLSADLKSPQEYDEVIRKYFRDNFGNIPFEITHEEIGIIPMTTQAFNERPHERIFQVGTAGGDTKATTGYTFKNIQQHCQEILEFLNTGNLARKRKASRFRFYDNILLSIIKNDPSKIPEIMLTLFQKNSTERITRFLDEKTNLWEELSIFRNLPWSPFINHILSPRI